MGLEVLVKTVSYTVNTTTLLRSRWWSTLLLLGTFLLLPGGTSIQVLEFQKDGVASLSTMAVYRGKLDRAWRMASLSLCCRFKLFFLHTRATFFQLWDKVDNWDSQIKGELWLNRFRPVVAHRWQFQILKDKLRTFKWYHLCFTYDHLKYLYNTFIDGKLVYEMTYNVKRQIYGDYARLGQSVLSKHSFSGALSQVNVWDSVLSADVIADMAACKTDPLGNYVSWEAGWDLYSVTEYNTSLESFCKQTMDTFYFGFPRLSKAQAFYQCEALGTHLPLSTNMDELLLLFNVSVQLWSGYKDLCITNFWASIIDVEREGTWVTHYDNVLAPLALWNDGEPNGNFYENCAKIEHWGLSDVDCLTDLLCAICEFTDLPILSLLGTCELEERNLHFIAYQEGLGDLYFKGYGAYHIKKVEGEWLWINVVENKTLARLDVDAPFNMPMGRRVWHLESPVCNQREGPRTLVLTPCGPDSYSCDDATCIPHQNRCDLKYDCLDHSDEAECQLVSQPEDYRKDLPPRQGNGVNASSLPITLHVNVESAAVDTTLMTMQLSYKIIKIWIDDRLNYRNLKINDSLNKVDYTSMMSLWSPIIAFVNTEGHQHTVVDIESSLYLKRQQPPDRSDNSAPGEVDLFPGKRNPLLLSRKYSTTFICDFDLMLYPFDVQFCDMRLQMLSGSKDFLNFEETNSSAAYYGSAVLLEYQVQQPKLVYEHSGEFSVMKVRLWLQRRSGYAILNIYMPSIIILAICYLTLFLRPHALDVRLMTTLTSLLVLATLFTQVSSSLPKTSYFKMVDVWLLFCIVISFMIIIFHVVIDYSLTEGGDEVSSPAMKPVTKVQPWTTHSRQSGKVYETSVSLSKYSKNLITFARWMTVGIFTLFNLIYWSYIFG
ncbi:uncharacterized protein [Procambarus clarkii]|uniref:uncharacterized protein n=1 Tax=Procambarus clarkii TaxID=6728 RepID=UPI0037434961